MCRVNTISSSAFIGRPKIDFRATIQLAQVSGFLNPGSEPNSFGFRMASTIAMDLRCFMLEFLSSTFVISSIKFAGAGYGRWDQMFSLDVMIAGARAYVAVRGIFCLHLFSDGPYDSVITYLSELI